MRTYSGLSAGLIMRDFDEITMTKNAPNKKGNHRSDCLWVAPRRTGCAGETRRLD